MHGGLAERIARPGFADEAARCVGSVASATDLAGMQAAFGGAVAALGAECGCFIHCEPADKGTVSYRAQSAGAADWARDYLDDRLYDTDPWLAYAQRRTEPVASCGLSVRGAAQQAVVDRAAAAGFASALLVPAHLQLRPRSFGLLLLGHPRPGWFDGAEALLPLRVCARSLAIELQDWWLAKSRLDRLAAVPVSALELELLALQLRGHTTAGIARALEMTPTAVNSRFQRLNTRLGHRNRRITAQWAFECGLITV